MDANRLDSLARSLAVRGTRRTLLYLLTGGTLGLAGWPHAEDVAAKKKCKKIKNRKKRKKCLKKAKQGETLTLPVCVPACGGKDCGDDGCGGSCGSCTAPETCQSGQCLCTSNCSGKTCGDNGCGGSCGPCTGGTCSVTGVCNCGSKEFCRGTCVECNGGRILNPDACTCCWPNGTQPPGGCLDLDDGCCSGICTTSGDFEGECNGMGDGGACSFDEQCESGNCNPGGICIGGIGG